MVFKFWLVVNDVGGAYIRKNRPSLAEGEVGIPMTINVPDAWFSRVTGMADITIMAPVMSGPYVAADKPQMGAPSTVLNDEDFEADEGEMQP